MAHKYGGAEKAEQMPRGRLRQGPLSAPAYFGCVFLSTLLVVGAAALLRPAFAMDLALWSGLKKPPQATAGSFFSVRVAPLFEKSCAGCHGERRQKAGLRLDSFAGVMRGGKHGAVFEAGNAANSELFKRIILPPEDDKAMPPAGKEPLSEDEITVIKLWLAYGASGDLPAEAIKEAPEPVKEVVFPEVDVAAVTEQRAPLASIVQQLQERFPGIIAYVSRGSADLAVNASLLGASFGDEELAALAPIGERIVWLDASQTSLTDNAAPVLARFSNLRVLRLTNTAVTDQTLLALSSLSALASVALTGTDVTANGLAAIKARGITVYADNIVTADKNED